MLQIYRESEDFSPIGDGIIFFATSDYPTDMMVKICNAQTDSVVGSKMINGVTEAIIDIAPYLESIDQERIALPSDCKMTKAPTKQYYVIVQDATQSVVSEVVTVSNNQLRISDMVVASAMPNVRKISYGECDDINIVVPKSTDVKVTIESDTGQKLEFLDSTDQTGDIFRVHISTTEFEQWVSSLNVAIYFNDIIVETIRYNIVARGEMSVRLAWISLYGSLERHTFPQILSHKLHCYRTQVTDKNGGEETIPIHTLGSVEVLSDYGGKQLTDAVAQIISTPKLWIDNGRLIPIILYTETVTTVRDNTSQRVKISFNYHREEVSL